MSKKTILQFELKFKAKLLVSTNGISEVLVSSTPISAQQVIKALQTLKNRLSPSDAKLTKRAFEKAETWVRRVAEVGGITPMGSKSFHNIGVNPNDARVDIEVLRGSINSIP